MSDQKKVDALRDLVREAAVEVRTVPVFHGDTWGFRQTFHMTRLLETLAESDALFVLDELLNGDKTDD